MESLSLQSLGIRDWDLSGLCLYKVKVPRNQKGVFLVEFQEPRNLFISVELRDKRTHGRPMGSELFMSLQSQGS